MVAIRINTDTAVIERLHRRVNLVESLDDLRRSRLTTQRREQTLHRFSARDGRRELRDEDLAVDQFADIVFGFRHRDIIGDECGREL